MVNITVTITNVFKKLMSVLAKTSKLQTVCGRDNINKQKCLFSLWCLKPKKSIQRTFVRFRRKKIQKTNEKNNSTDIDNSYNNIIVTILIMIVTIFH